MPKTIRVGYQREINAPLLLIHALCWSHRNYWWSDVKPAAIKAHEQGSAIWARRRWSVRATIASAANIQGWRRPLFTGLVKGIGQVQRSEKGADGRVFQIACRDCIEDVTLGESVAVHGVCLTVEGFEGAAAKPTSFACTAGHETLACTTLGALRSGDEVHLEQALRLSDRIGGHLVTGHVDNLGVVTHRKNIGVGFDLTVEAPSGFADLLVEKGSIAIDGVSLTIARAEGHIFSVMIIPHTADKTLLGAYQPGRKVNLEGDIIGKYVKHVLGRGNSQASKDAHLGELLGAWSKES